MTQRIHNFSAGPCTLPLEVLEEARDEFVDYHGAGMSLIEMSHRGPQYEAVHQEAADLAREVFGAPDSFDVVFIQGGASLQFAMVPMNFLPAGGRASYVHTGAWAKRGIADARVFGDIDVVWDGTPDYHRTPRAGEVAVPVGTSYLHITTNETIGGVRFHEWPDVDVPIVADMSSEYMSRAIPWDRFGLVYGGVQKNLGPAGMALVFIDKAFAATGRNDLPAYLRYGTHVESDSMYNTPPVFTIYMMGKVLKWMKSQGGLDAMAASAEAKAGALYAAIDHSDGYFRSPVEVESRSLMNVVFRLPTEALEKAFIEEAADKGLQYLKGHRSVGGCRASIYNALPAEAVADLVGFMTGFRKTHPA